MKLLSTIVLASAVSVSSAFVSSTRSATSSTQRQPSTNDEQQSDLLTVMRMSNDDGKDAGGGPFGGFNPLKEIGDMFQNLDDGELIGTCLYVMVLRPMPFDRIEFCCLSTFDLGRIAE